MIPKLSRAFTLVEAIVVCAVLLVIAGAIIPNWFRVVQSRTLKDLEGKIARLPAETRNEAVKTQTPARIRLSGTLLVMEQAPKDGAPVRVKTIDLGTDLQVGSMQINGKPTDSGSWLWTAYPDGSADSGGVQFTEGKVQKALVLSATGDAQWLSGPLPDQSQDQWPAGTLLQRS